ncbi:MAG: nucleotide exchange factor GrpE [Acidobacteriaceae bacterium]|nr:nucleotide exchange factor GrpE [Acidobacteriaceae bacterium]
MNAVETEETSAAPDGTVLAVYRNGYEWNGKVYRPAQVKVAKAPVRPQ